MFDSFSNSAAIYKALADETRLQILHMLAEGEMCACKILEKFEISQPTLSYHMKILSSCGLVSSQKDGLLMIYSIRPDGYKTAREMLATFEKGSLTGTLYALLPENLPPDTNRNDAVIRDLLYANEVALLKPEVRRDPKKLSELISDSFCEHTASGHIYHYHAGDTFGGGSTYDGDCLIIDFSVRKLSAETALVTYKVVTNSQPDDSKKVTMRASIWRIESDNWKIIFHQGTYFGARKTAPNGAQVE